MNPRRQGRSAVAFVAALLVGCGPSAAELTDEGDAHLRAGALEDAEKSYSRALLADPGYARAAYGKGWALAASGYPQLQDVARNLFDRAIELEPEYWGGYRGKAVLLLRDGQTLAAENLLRRANELSPGQPEVLETYGLVYLAGGEYADAERLFQEALSRAPERVSLHRFLSDVDAQLGDEAAVLAHLADGARAPDPTPQETWLLFEGELHHHVRLAQSALRRRDPAAALQALEGADRVLLQLQAVPFAEDETEGLRLRLGTLRAEIEADLE